MIFEALNDVNIPQEIKDRYETLTDDLKKLFNEFLDPDWEHTPEQAMEEVDAMIEINNLPDIEGKKEIALSYLRKPSPGLSPKRALEEYRAIQEIKNLPEELQKEIGEVYIGGSLNQPLPTEVLEKFRQEQK